MFFDTYDTPVFRPPSEARSFILRVTRGCAHNKCTYCNMYRGVPFQILKDEEISRQIALAAHFGKDRVRRVFLADGDALVLPTAKLLKILQAYCFSLFNRPPFLIYYCKCYCNDCGYCENGNSYYARSVALFKRNGNFESLKRCISCSA